MRPPGVIPVDELSHIGTGGAHAVIGADCYARPSHSYLNLSPGLDFETRIIAKRNIAAVLQRELLRPAYQPDLLALGTVTDAYQPVERELRLTRAVLEVLHAERHPLDNSRFTPSALRAQRGLFD
jgi:hypothetical protein